MRAALLFMKSVCLCACLAGCASVTDPRALQGQPYEQIRASMGRPDLELRLGDGRLRRFYTDPTSLVRTWRADFDHRDHLLDITPATTSAEFAETLSGQWQRSELIERFGPPYKTENAEGDRTWIYYLFNEFGMRKAYWVFLCDEKGKVLRSESRRIEQPANIHSRPDVGTSR